jgi:hypothetical protein
MKRFYNFFAWIVFSARTPLLSNCGGGSGTSEPIYTGSRITSVTSYSIQLARSTVLKFLYMIAMETGRRIRFTKTLPLTLSGLPKMTMWRIVTPDTNTIAMAIWPSGNISWEADLMLSGLMVTKLS